MRRFLLVVAALVATSSSSWGQSAKLPARSNAGATPGEFNNGIYRNSFFSFSYKPPYGWVDRTAEMREAPADRTKTDGAKTDPANALVLLGVFERPPEATGPTVNSAVVIAAESVSSYP